MGGGAWPFLVRGVICLVNSDNERDSNILNRCIQDYDVEVLHNFFYWPSNRLIKYWWCEMESYLFVCLNTQNRHLAS